MLKVVGLLAIIAACTLAGQVVAGSYRNRCRHLRQMMTALKMLETQIVYGATALPEAAVGVAKRSQPPVSLFFQRLHLLLVQGGGMPASEAWARALQEIDNTWALTAADTAILRDLGPNLGTSDRQDQSRYLQMAMKQLEGELGRAEELASKNGRLWRWLGLLGGLFLALLLL